MSLIVGEGICKRWTDDDVLKNVCFILAPEQRVAIVGANGEGKTTLLRIMAGQETPTEGKLTKKTGLRSGYLPQDPPALEGSTLRQAMLDVFADLHRMEQELHEMTEKMGQDCHDPKMLVRYGELQHQFEDRGGYTYSHRIDQVLGGLGFDQASWTQPLAELSGGQRTRAYLARLLLEEPEVLLLDEPTNHLDIAAVEWLEKWLTEFRGAVVVVSHDRYFLDRSTTDTWEISFSALECYRGSYSQYLTKRQERYLERLKRWEAQQEYIAETQEFIRRFLAGQRSKEAQGRRTRLERFMKTEAMERPREHESITVRLRTFERTGEQVFQLRDLQAGYAAGRPLVSLEKLDVFRGQRIAIVGPNGCGKTTLIRTIVGSLPPLAGTVRRGSNVSIGYLSQTHAELSPTWTPIEAVRQVDPAMPEQRARNLLGSLQLGGDHVFKRICELSGGQRSRIVLARLMLQHANVLMLDEPTNHLDVQSQEVLQEVLSEFDGTVLLVSHDRYLISALATHIWVVGDGGVLPLVGSWDKYLEWRDRQAGLTEPPAVRQASAHQKWQERKEDFAQRRKRTNEVQRMQRRLADVEKLVEQSEARLQAINDEIGRASQAGNLDEVTKLGEEYAKIDPALRKLIQEWEQLSTNLEQDG